MTQVILIGTHGETRAYAVAGLRCFEPGLRHLVERVLAERVRCDVLALTLAAYAQLPGALADELRESPYPRLAILPATADSGEALRVTDRLLGRTTGGGPVAA